MGVLSVTWLIVGVSFAFRNPTSAFNDLLDSLGYIFGFPGHILFREFFTRSGSVSIAGFFLNSLFYGILIERIFWAVKVIRRRTAKFVT